MERQVQRARGEQVLLMSGEQEGGDTGIWILQKPAIRQYCREDQGSGEAQE